MWKWLLEDGVPAVDYCNTVVCIERLLVSLRKRARKLVSRATDMVLYFTLFCTSILTQIILFFSLVRFLTSALLFKPLVASEIPLGTHSM